jgi:hypothetical protein
MPLGWVTVLVTQLYICMLRDVYMCAFISLSFCLLMVRLYLEVGLVWQSLAAAAVLSRSCMVKCNVHVRLSVVLRCSAGVKHPVIASAEALVQSITDTSSAAACYNQQVLPGQSKARMHSCSLATSNQLAMYGQCRQPTVAALALAGTGHYVAVAVRGCFEACHPGQPRGSAERAPLRHLHQLQLGCIPAAP